MIEGLLIGLSAAITPFNLMMVVMGCVIGTLIGMLPGLGPMSIIAIMIPVAIGIGDPAAALILLSGVYYGAIFGGSTSSILLNAPGVAGTVATSFDGYPMARKGQAGKALTIAAIASFAGGTIGAVLLMVFAPALSTVALLFHSAEYFALMVVGLSAIAAFAGTGQVAKALMMTILGLMLGTVGEGALSNMPRFTFGMMELQSGFSFITLAMAMFALPEALFLVMNPARAATGDTGKITGMRITRAEARSIAPVIGRQSLQGFFIGVLPGAGATIASFLGYAVERNIAKGAEQEEFGKGSIKGLAAPETANNAACTGSFVPLLTLGVPGSGTTAVLLGALLVMGVNPGPAMMEQRPDVFWGVVASMYIGNIFLLVLNLPLIPLIAKILDLPRPLLLSMILIFCMIGVYGLSFSVFDLFLLLGFGLIGLGMRLFGFPAAPLILALILGSLMEESMRRALQISGGDWGIFIAKPIALGLLSLALLSLFMPMFKKLRKRKALNS